MIKYFTLFFIILTLSCAKESEPLSSCYTDGNPPRNNEKVTINQGVWGDVWFWEGNFMPMSRGKICQVQRMIYIFELTKMSEVEAIGYTPFYSAINTDLVTTTESDTNGFFQVELEPGSYSLFVMEDTSYYSNLFDSGGAIFPVKIESGKVTEVRFDITYEASY